MKTKILLFFLPVMLMTACLDHGLSEVPLELSSDQEEVFAVADIMTGDGELSKTIKIISNKSWSAHLNDLDNPIDESDVSQSVPWGSLSVEEHSNVTNVTDEVEITVNFNRNFSKSQINGVLNIYSDGGLRKSIPLTQAGVIYSLAANYDGDNPVSDNGGMINIEVKSNAPWSVRVDESTTADAVLLNSEGIDNGTVQIRLRSNDDPVTKSLKLVFSADDCDDVVLDLVQKEIDPSIKIFDFNTVFRIDGTNKNQIPVVILDDSSIAPELKEAGIKFYYKSGTEGFTDDLIPDNSCPEFPADGVFFADLNVALSRAYVEIMADCPGYRSVYKKVYARHWRTCSTGQTESGPNGFNITVAPSKVSASSWTLDNKLQTFGTKAEIGGKCCAYYMAHNLTRTPQMTFLLAGTKCGSYTYVKSEADASHPLAKVSSFASVKPGEDICVEVTNKKGPYLWSFASLEQINFKP